MPEDKGDKTIGAVLREARTVKSVTLEQASKGTKIHPNILRALESDNYKSLGAVYIKSFIRMYADFLGLNKEDLVRRFESLSGKKADEFTKAVNAMAAEPPSEITDIFSKTRKRALAFFRKADPKLLIAVGVVLVLAFVFVKVISSRKSPRAVAAKPPVEQSAAKQAAAVAKSGAAKTAVPKVPDTAASSTPSEKPVIPKAALAEPGVVAKLPEAPQKEKIALVIRAKDKCWLQAKVDGKVVFQNVLTKGAAESWQAKEKIELWLGNAGAVQLELNGKLLERIGRPGQAIKRVVVTRSGLEVQR